MFISFKDFNSRYGLQNAASSNVKMKEISGKINTHCGIYTRDYKFIKTSGVVNLHPTKGTHWDVFYYRVLL